MSADDRRFRLRRPPAIHRPPATPAPETPEEVLRRAPDVSRETVAKDAESAAWAALAAVPPAYQEAFQLGMADLQRRDQDVPPLRKDQVIRLEALTALWERQVRLEGPADATLLYSAPPPPPPPRPAPALEAPVDLEPAAPPVDAGQVAQRSRQLLEEEALEESRTPGPAPVPDPGTRAEEPVPARVSDWHSRHDPRSLEYPVRQLLARPVPLQDVSLPGGPPLDQGTTPPLDVRTASACTGMAAAAAANVLVRRGPATLTRMVLEDEARTIYFRAQDLDHVSGHAYPGTSVLAAMRAGQEAGWWESYLWALGGTRDVAQVLLQLRVAVVLGLPWSTRLEEPDRDGVIVPGGADNGGHALAAVGLRLQVAGRPGPWFELQQSRGPGEGIGGRVFMHHRDLARLLAGVGEAAVPLPGDVLQ